MDELIKRVKNIVENIIYITIATSTKNGQPWNTPVYAVHNKNYEFFWISWVNAQHSVNIRENGNVFIVIFDPTRKLGENHKQCLYIKAKAHELQSEDDVENAITCFKENSKKLNKKDFTGEKSIKRIYKAIPEKMWLNSTSESQLTTKTTNMRIEVPLDDLKSLGKT